MSALQPTVILTEEQIAAFHRDGFLALDSITTQEEIESLIGIYDRIFNQRAGRKVGDQFDLAGTDEGGKEAALPQILNPSKYAPELAETLYHVNALAITKQLLGPEAIYSGDHAILKPPHSPAPTPWHQDEAYWDPGTEYVSLSVWMPLQDVTMENGCMQFVPGTHKLEVMPHQSINNDPRIHGLELAEPLDESKAVACPLPAGGATFHLSRTLHYTAPNNSETPRRAYILIFGTPPKRRDTPRDFPWQAEKRTAREERSKQAKVTESQPAG